jgi:hypothetical protein
MPLARGLMAVRGMSLRRKGGGDSSISIYGSLSAGPGFMALGETEDAFAIGFVGTPWKPKGGRPPGLKTPEEFAAWDEPGWIKALTTMQALRAPERCSLLVTETHIAPTDETAARNFGRYWALVQHGSGLVRRSWLAAAARHAESAASVR